MSTFERLRHALSCPLPCRGCASSHSRTPQQSSCLRIPASMRAMTPPARGRTPEARGRPPQGRCSAPCSGPRPCFPLRSCRHFYPPIFLRLSFHGRRIRVLHFKPIGGEPGGGILALRDDPLEAKLAGVGE